MTVPQPTRPAPSTLNRRRFIAAAGAGVAGSSLLTMLRGPPGARPDQGHDPAHPPVEPLHPRLRRLVRQVRQGVGRQERGQGAGRPHPPPRDPGAHGRRVRGRRRPRHHLQRLVHPDPALLQEPRRPHRRRRRRRQEVRGLDPRGEIARRGGGPLVWPSDLLHPGADALPEGPLRRQQPASIPTPGSWRGWPRARSSPKGIPRGSRCPSAPTRTSSGGRCSSASAGRRRSPRARTPPSTPRSCGSFSASPRRSSTRA